MTEHDRKKNIQRSIRAILIGPRFSALDNRGKPRAEISDKDFLALAVEALRAFEPRIEIEESSLRMSANGAVDNITLRYSDKDTDDSDVITISYL